MSEKPSRNVTMQDVARKAGVSPITVSRALGGGAVNAETRQRILAAADEMGYQFNHAARNLRLQRTNTVAVVIEMQPTPGRPIGEPYPMSLLGGIIEELSVADYSAMLLTAEKFLRLPPSVDAVILLGQGLQNDAVTLVERCNLPLVVWGSARNDEDRHVVVGSNNVEGGRLAAERFLQLGRRRALFLGDVGHAETADRLDGFTEEFSAGGGNVRAVICSDFTFDAGYDAMLAAILAHGRDFDCVFAACDAIAMGAIRSLIQAGRRISEEVSVIGFDDAASAQLFAPPLTTIHQDWHEGGRQLARKALALVQGESATTTLLPVRLITRGT